MRTKKAKKEYLIKNLSPRIAFRKSSSNFHNLISINLKIILVSELFLFLVKVDFIFKKWTFLNFEQKFLVLF